MSEERVVPGPEQAEAMYLAHGRALRAFVASRVRDAAAVEDICQETFVAALDRGVPPEKVGPWLFGIARNKVLKHLRDYSPPAPGRDGPGPGEGPAELLGQSEERARVQAAVAGLEDELREVIRLRYEGGLEYRQIADYLELPFTTVQGRLKRARLALRAALLPPAGGAS